MKRFITSTLITLFLIIMNINAQWIRSGLDSKALRDICTHNNHLYVATNTEGIFRSTDNGTTWAQINISSTNPYLLWIVSTGTSILTGGVNGLYRSTDNGNTWGKIFDNQVYYCFKSGSNIYAAVYGEGIKLSVNDGLTWIDKNTGIENVGSYKVLASGSSVILGTTNGGFYVSTNGGDTWTLKNTGLPNKILRPMYINGQILWVTSSGSGIFRSTDFGNSWSQIGANFGQWLHITEYQNTFFLWGDPDYRFSVSPNNGTTWNLSNTGLVPNYGYVYGCCIINNNIYLATSDGVWKRPLSELLTSVEDEVPLPSEFFLEQNYPNPFNPQTKISFKIPDKSFINLSIYDIQGNRIRTLLKGEYFPGSYSVDFDGTGLSSGVYFYQLKSLSGTLTKKMLLIK